MNEATIGLDSMVREAIEVSRNAREHGNHPFGAILIDAEGNRLLSAENTVETDCDCTAHAERNLVALATKTYTEEFLKSCTLISSAEPCPMCSGAIYWSNIGRVVYGLSEKRLYEISDPDDQVGLLLSCREVLGRGKRDVTVIGPMLEDEAQELPMDFWNSL